MSRVCRAPDQAGAMLRRAGVLARLTIGPLDPATARTCYPDGAPDVGAILDLSGGDPTDDTRLGCCAPDPILNRMARESAANMRVLLHNPADPDDLDDPPSLATVRAVVRAAVRVAEHAIGVVVPEARAHYTVPDFVDATTWRDGNAAPRHSVDVSMLSDGTCLMTTTGVG